MHSYGVLKDFGKFNSMLRIKISQWKQEYTNLLLQMSAQIAVLH